MRRQVRCSICRRKLIIRCVNVFDVVFPCIACDSAANRPLTNREYGVQVQREKRKGS